jgi:hypothetical protein
MDIKTTLENVILSLALPEKKEKKLKKCVDDAIKEPKKRGRKPIKFDSLDTYLEEVDIYSKSNEEKLKLLESYIQQRSEDAGTEKEINYVKKLIKEVKPKGKRGRPKGSGKVVPKGSVKPSVRPKKEKTEPPKKPKKPEPKSKLLAEKERQQMGKEDFDAPKAKRGRPKAKPIADRKNEEKEREQMGQEDFDAPKAKRGRPKKPPKKSKPIKDRKNEEKERQQMGQEDFIIPEPQEKVEEPDQSRVFDESFDVEDYIIEPLPIISKKIELAKINDKFKGIDNQLDKEKKQKIKEIRDKLTKEIQRIREEIKPLRKGKTEKQLEALLNKEDRKIDPFKKESDKTIKEITKKYDKLIEDNKNQYNNELEAFDKRDLEQEVVDLMVDIFKSKIVNDKTISIMDDDIFNIEIDGDSMTYNILDIMDFLIGKYNELKGTDYKSRRIFDEEKGEELIKFFKKKSKKGGLLVRSDKIRGGEMTATISRGRGIRKVKYPHKMYKDGDIQVVLTEEEHNRFLEEGYTHRKGGVLRSDKIGTLKEQMVRGKTKRTQTRKRQIAKDDVGPTKKRGRPRAIAKDTIAPPFISKLDIEIKPIDIRKIKVIDELSKRKENILRFADDPVNFYDVPTRFL